MNAALEMSSTLEDLLDTLAQRIVDKLRAEPLPFRSEAPDRLMTLRETAARLGVVYATLSRNADNYPFCIRQPGTNRPMFSEHGLLKWLAEKGIR